MDAVLSWLANQPAVIQTAAYIGALIFLAVVAVYAVIIVGIVLGAVGDSVTASFPNEPMHEDAPYSPGFKRAIKVIALGLPVFLVLLFSAAELAAH